MTCFSKESNFQFNFFSVLKLVMSSIQRKSDQCSVIKRLIMQHVMKERPDFLALAEDINRHNWVIMKDLEGSEEEANEFGEIMCEVVHAHGEFATVCVCFGSSEPYTSGQRTFVIHLSRWSEFFVEWHTDYYQFADSMGTGGNSTVLGKRKRSL